MEDKKYYDANGHEFIIQEEDFQLVQHNQVIYDEKFKTKPTTYLKDAFRRFCKNKSSVVAAIIIGILMLLSFTVPVLSPHDLDSPKMDQDLLPSKLFDPGTGFWDGTKKYENIIYDPATGGPAGFKANAVVMDSVVSVDEYLDDFSPYAHGGTYIFEGDKAKIKENDYVYDYLRHRTAIKFTRDNQITVTIKFSDEFNADKHERAEYRIVYQNKIDGSSDYKVITDWTTELTEQSFNMSDWLVSNNLTEVTGYVRIDVKTASGITKYPALYFDSIVFHSALSDAITEDTPEEEIDPEVLELTELLDDISITDANATKNLQIADRGSWATTGTTAVIKTFVSYWTFLYDEYEASLGYMESFEIGASIMRKYIENGWCEYDFTKGAESFVKLSDKCPIDSVRSQASITINGNEVINLDCEVQLYKYLGYDEIPRFIFGTDAGGYDLFTRAFSSLRKSLAVSILVFVVTFAFGLVWGAISGYFGGNVDLVLERLRDIIGSIPTLVLVTLALIIWGRTIWIFALAICITGWVGTAGLTRTQFYRFKGREYILSSRTLGASDTRLIAKHILPNSLGTIVTSSILRIPGFIFTESTFAYLGLGLTGTDSFGVILSDNQIYINSLPILILFPSALISLLMISFNLFGNGLRDALNPSLKGSE